MKIETVNIKADNDAGFRVINKDDFDETQDALFDDGAKVQTVAEIRDALTAKGIEIPEGAKKADLLALLSGSN